MKVFYSAVLTVRKELLTEELRLEIEEWNKEGDIALTPDLNSRHSQGYK